MIATHEARHISVTIRRSLAEVDTFMRNPANLPRWATGLGGQIECEDDVWFANGTLGRITIRFCADNAFGVLDHDVTLPSGETNRNPLRVIENGEGSEVVFSLFRLPGVTADQFDADEAWIRKDLHLLKSILEG